jgi:ABC-2 type transport system ATP-binding protein
MLQAKGLSKRFADRWALHPLDLEVRAGQIQCLLGANGAGKTTTLNLFLGFIDATGGTAFVDGQDVSKDVQAARARLAYVPEQVNLYPTLSGLENLTYFTKLARRPASDEQLIAQLREVGLEPGAAHRRVEHYSKGMRQKVGLAIALAKDARALLLDEPLSGLDPQAANELCELLRLVAQRDVAVLMATHDIFRACEVATRIGIMRSGSLVEDLDARAVSPAALERIYLDHMQCVRVDAGDAP